MTETTPVTTPIIEVVDGNVVHKTRTGKLFRPDTVHANKNINFVARRDEVVGLVGESGCGKSTLARVMVGLQPLTSGKILFKGVPLKPRGAQRKQLGQSVSVVFQDPATSLNPRMSVHDQLLDPLKVHGVGDHASREKRVRELVSLVGLPQSALDVLPRQISGGQRQRVAIARALALEPDLSVRAQVLNLLLDLKKEFGLGLVFISHDINTVRYVSDRICVMLSGEIIEQNTTDNIFNHAEQEYTRTLLAATPSLL